MSPAITTILNAENHFVTRLVCAHLHLDHELDYCQWFDGSGMTYRLACLACRQQCREAVADIDAITWRQVDDETFTQIEQDGCWEVEECGIFGSPPVRVGATAYVLQPGESIDCPAASMVNASPKADHFLALTPDRKILRIHGTTVEIVATPDLGALEGDLLLATDAAERFFSVFECHGTRGIDWRSEDPNTGVPFSREAYHNAHSSFAVCYFDHDGITYRIQASSWDRLDLHIAETCEPVFKQADDCSLHSGIFHCMPIVSPNGQWVAEFGWIWHPVGVLRAWPVAPWLHDPGVQSESDASKGLHRLWDCSYFWDSPMCFLDDQRLAVWGYGSDETNVLDAAMIFNLDTGTAETWLPGPNGLLHGWNGQLVSTSRSKGVSVWNVERGECCFADEGLEVVAFQAHNGTLLIADGDRLREARLIPV